MSSYTELNPLMEILLHAVAKECNTTQEHISFELEQTILGALVEAMKIGEERADNRPTPIHPADPNLRWPRGTFKG